MKKRCGLLPVACLLLAALATLGYAGIGRPNLEDCAAISRELERACVPHAGEDRKAGEQCVQFFRAAAKNGCAELERLALPRDGGNGRLEEEEKRFRVASLALELELEEAVKGACFAGKDVNAVWKSLASFQENVRGDLAGAVSKLRKEKADELPGCSPAPAALAELSRKEALLQAEKPALLAALGAELQILHGAVKVRTLDEAPSSACQGKARPLAEKIRGRAALSYVSASSLNGVLVALLEKAKQLRQGAGSCARAEARPLPKGSSSRAKGSDITGTGGKDSR